MIKHPWASFRDQLYIASLVAIPLMIMPGLARSQVAALELQSPQNQADLIPDSVVLENASIEQAVADLQNVERATLIIETRSEDQVWGLDESKLRKYGRTYTACDFRHINELLGIIKNAEFEGIGIEGGAVFWNLRAILSLKKQNGSSFQIALGSTFGAGYVPGNFQGKIFKANPNFLDHLLNWGREGVIDFPNSREIERNSIHELFDFLRFLNKQQCTPLTSLSPPTIDEELSCQAELSDSCN